MATSTKENQAVIVQEDQDDYFREKMEEYKLCQIQVVDQICFYLGYFHGFLWFLTAIHLEYFLKILMDDFGTPMYAPNESGNKTIYTWLSS